MAIESNKLPPRLAGFFKNGKPTDVAIQKQEDLNKTIFGVGSLRSKGANSIFQKTQQA